MDALRTPVRRALWAGAVALGISLPAVRMAVADLRLREEGQRWCTQTGAAAQACSDALRDHHRVCARMVWGRAGAPGEPPEEERRDYVVCVLSHPNQYARGIRANVAPPNR